MDAYEKLLQMMKSKTESRSFFIAVMQNQTDCKADNLILDKEDLYYSKQLTSNGASLLEAGDLVAVFKLNEEKYIIMERLVEL